MVEAIGRISKRKEEISPNVQETVSTLGRAMQWVSEKWGNAPEFISPSALRAIALAGIIGIQPGTSRAQDVTDVPDARLDAALALQLANDFGMPYEDLTRKMHTQPLLVARLPNGQPNPNALIVHLIRQRHGSPLEQDLIERHQVASTLESQTAIYSLLKSACERDPHLTSYKEGLTAHQDVTSLIEARNRIRGVMGEFNTPTELNTFDNVFQAIERVQNGQVVAAFLKNPDFEAKVKGLEQRVKEKAAELRADPNTSTEHKADLSLLDAKLALLGINQLLSGMGNLMQGSGGVMVSGGAEIRLYLEGVCPQPRPSEDPQVFVESRKIIAAFNVHKSKYLDVIRTAMNVAFSSPELLAIAPRIQEARDLLNKDSASRSTEDNALITEQFAAGREVLRRLVDTHPEMIAHNKLLEELLQRLSANSVDRDEALIDKIEADARWETERGRSPKNVFVVRGAEHIVSFADERVAGKRSVPGWNGLPITILAHTPLKKQQ